MMMGSGKEMDLVEDLDLESDLDQNDDLDLGENELGLDEDVIGGQVIQSTTKRVRMIFSVMASPNRIDILRILNSKGPLLILN